MPLASRSKLRDQPVVEIRLVGQARLVGLEVALARSGALANGARTWSSSSEPVGGNDIAESPMSSEEAGRTGLFWRRLNRDGLASLGVCVRRLLVEASVATRCSPVALGPWLSQLACLRRLVFAFASTTDDDPRIIGIRAGTSVYSNLLVEFFRTRT